MALSGLFSAKKKSYFRSVIFIPKMRKNIIRHVLFYVAVVLTLHSTAQSVAPVPANDGGLHISVTPDARMTGRSNHREVLMRVMVVRDSDAEERELVSLTVSLQGTVTGDVRILEVLSTGSSPKPISVGSQSVLQENTTYDPVPKQPNSLQTVLIRNLNPNLSDDILVPLHYRLTTDTTYLWITADISDSAKEGNRIVLELKDLRTLKEIYPINIQSEREILLRRRVLYCPGDFDSQFYRIPAVITAKDGSLVAATDRRKFSNADLPEDIDIILNHSTDGGHSWSGPQFLAIGTGKGKGFGDCALAHTRDEGGLIAVFAGGVGLWQSTPEEPQRIYCRRSTDNGRSWSPAVDITHYLYGLDCADSVRRHWRAAFCASGNGLLTSTDRILFVVAVREGEAYSLNNYVLYSDDNGETWQCSQRASVGGDEAKVVELRDGRLLMSIRHQGERWFNISEDSGITWRDSVFTTNFPTAPACNGDMIRYDREDNTSVLLHSLPLGDKRENVAVMLSYDEGKSWSLGHVIVPYSSAYSSLCLLPDGTIGMYVEEDPHGRDRYEMVFYNFTLEWLEGR